MHLNKHPSLRKMKFGMSMKTNLKSAQLSKAKEKAKMVFAF